MAAMVSGVALCPRMAEATSPGSISVHANTSTEAAHSVTIPNKKRLIRREIMTPASKPPEY